MVVRPRAMQGFPPDPAPRPKVPSMIRGKKEDGLLRNFPFFTNIPITGDAHGRGDGLPEDCPGNGQTTTGRLSSEDSDWVKRHGWSTDFTIVASGIFSPETIM